MGAHPSLLHSRMPFRHSGTAGRTAPEPTATAHRMAPRALAWSRCIVLALCAASASAASATPAGTPASPAPLTAPPAAPPSAALAAVAEEDWDARAALAALPPSGDDDGDVLRQKRATLTSLVATMDLAEQRRAREAGRQSALAPEALPPLPAEGPVSMLLVDAWRDARDAALAERATYDDELGALRIDATERAADLRRAREEYRLWRERAMTAGDGGAQGAEAEAQADLRLWRGRYAEYLHANAVAAIDAVSARRTELDRHAVEFERRIASALPRQTLDEDHLARVAAQRAAERQRAEARIARLARANPAVRVPLAAARSAEEELLAVLDGRELLWRLRQRVLENGGSEGGADALGPIIEDALRQVALRERWVAAELDEALAEQAANPDLEGALADAAADEVRSRRRLLDGLGRSRVLLERATEDLAALGPPSGGALATAWSTLRRLASDLWEWELFVVTDRQTVEGREVVQEHGVTLGKGLGALLLLAVGYWAVGGLGRLLRHRVLPLFGLAPQPARTVARWIGGLLMLVVVLLVLNVARIPLVAFAFLGGALAIGIGFGAQTLLKNIMSGALILLERRIRVGDVLTVGGTSGTCTDVGLRSTTLAGFDGIDVIVPNSVLLEAAVSNWTGSDRFVRREVTLTIPCDGNEGRVAELACECAMRTAGVRPEPAPRILFTRFIDGGVELTVQFWIQVGGSPSAPEIESQLRFELTRTLVDLGITMLPPTRVTLMRPVGRPHPS